MLHKSHFACVVWFLLPSSFSSSSSPLVSSLLPSSADFKSPHLTASLVTDEIQHWQLSLLIYYRFGHILTVPIILFEMGRSNNTGVGAQDHRSQSIGNRHSRAPIDHFRKRLGSREVHSSGGRKEKAALVRGAEAAVTRRSNIEFFTSTPFLVFVLIVLICIVTYIFWSLAQTPVVRMNQPPADFVKRAPSDHLPSYTRAEAVAAGY